MYTNALGRAPDVDGLNYWLGQLRGGLARENVLTSFAESEEGRASILGVVPAHFEDA